MSAKEMMDRNIPLAREFKPISGIPPVGIEMAVGEIGYDSEGVEDVFEDCEEDEEEGDHEGEEHQGYAFA